MGGEPRLRLRGLGCAPQRRLEIRGRSSRRRSELRCSQTTGPAPGTTRHRPRWEGRRARTRGRPAQRTTRMALPAAADDRRRSRGRPLTSPTQDSKRPRRTGRTRPHRGGRVLRGRPARRARPLGDLAGRPATKRDIIAGNVLGHSARLRHALGPEISAPISGARVVTSLVRRAGDGGGGGERGPAAR
jgi:hypothetical protein